MDHVAKHPSLWIETAALPEHPVLEGTIDADVCIIGGGITGLTAATLLKRAGKSVVVVEALRCGGGETGHTTAHVSTHHDLYYRDTISRFGEDEARLILSSRRAAIAQIETFIVEGEIACHWERVPAYLYAHEASSVAELREETEACARLGMDVEFTQDVPVRFPHHGAMRIANQAQFHPLQYLAALAAGIPGAGCRVFEHTRVTNIAEGRVETERGAVTCRDVILATNSPVQPHGLLITKIAAYRTYAMALSIDAAAAPAALLWDTADPYHYVRTHRAGGASFLVVGGEDHKTGQGEEVDAHAAWKRLESWTRGRFAAGEIVAQWSGQVLEPADGLPYIGRQHDRVWVATGFSGDGITNGTLAGMLLTEEVMGEHSPLAKLYDPSRLGSMASKEYVRENIDFPLHMLTDRLKKPAGQRLRVVPPGEGKIIRVGKEKLAVYREESGVVHAFSPVCPHMGCHVKYNAAETSWDCPCHGSRFDATTGEVLNGPAASGLEARDVTDRASAAPPLPSRTPTRPSFPGASARASRRSQV